MSFTSQFSKLQFSKGSFSFIGEDKVKFMTAWQLRKKLGKPESPDPLGVYGIYRVRSIKGTERTEKMPFYVPSNPRTLAQQANRQKFADAMLAWKNLTELEKERYNKEAKSKMLFGWNVFIKEYFAMH
jgi:hypothetical protein